MKKIILLLSAVLLWALPVSVSAQNKNNDKAKQQRKEQTGSVNSVGIL